MPPLEVRQEKVARPFFSVCIPQHNRTSFLLQALRSLSDQTFTDFEVCISDDCSTDGREQELLDYLERSGLSFCYRRQEKNVRYDANLRAAMALARGDFCFLLGNDDCLASARILGELRDALVRAPADVVLTNYQDFETGRVYRRIASSGVLGSGPETALAHFRSFSFVSGVVLSTLVAREHASNRWDGSEMYQLHLGCRVIAAGGRLLGLERVTVLKDLQIPGEGVDSYATRPRIEPCPIIERRLPLGELGRVAFDAIQPCVAREKKAKLGEAVLRQILLFTYAFWVFEYRRTQSWKYAVGVCLGMRLKNIASGVSLTPMGRLRLGVIHLGVTFGGLLIPLFVFDRLYVFLYRVAKSSAAGRRALAMQS